MVISQISQKVQAVLSKTSISRFCFQLGWQKILLTIKIAYFVTWRFINLFWLRWINEEKIELNVIQCIIALARNSLSENRVKCRLSTKEQITTTYLKVRSKGVSDRCIKVVYLRNNHQVSVELSLNSKPSITQFLSVF